MPPRSTAGRRSLAAIFAPVLVAALISCAAMPAAHERKPTPNADLPDLSGLTRAHGVIATAEVISVDGRASGRAEIWTSDDGLLELRLTDVATTLPVMGVAGTVDVLTENHTCLDSHVRLDFPDLEPGLAYRARFDPAMFRGGDPTGLAEIVLTAAPATADPDGCLAPIAGRGPLDWLIAPRVEPIVPRDAGARDGARGEVLVDGEKPIAYTVSTGDVLIAIAERFGVRPDDIMYLNPARSHSPDLIVAGEVLNLDPHDR